MNATSTLKSEKIGALVTYLLTAVFGWLGALIGWLFWKDKGALAKDQTTEALNFGITTLIGFVAIGLVVHLVPSLGLLSVVLWIMQLVFSVIGAVTINKGTSYRYPFSLRLVK